MCCQGWGVGRGVHLHPGMWCVSAGDGEEGASAPRDEVPVLAGRLLVMRMYLHAGVRVVCVAVSASRDGEGVGSGVLVKGVYLHVEMLYV